MIQNREDGSLMSEEESKSGKNRYELMTNSVFLKKFLRQ